MMNQSIALISELVSIDHGKYIVKVTVNSQQVILGTGLAAAETVEIAEDRARERALAIINLTVPSSAREAIDFPSPSSKQTVSSHNSTNLPTPETVTPTQVNSQTESNPPAGKSTRETKKQPQLPISASKVSASNQPQATSKLETTLEITPISDSNSESALNVNESVTENQSPSIQTEKDNSPKPNFIEDNSSIDNDNQTENELTLPLEFPSKTQEIYSESTETALPIVQSDNDSQIDNLNSEKELSFTFSNNAEEESIDTGENAEDNPITDNLTEENNLLETIDFNQIIDQTSIEMKRLNWTQEQGKKYLLETYGKKSRHLLSDEELIEFLNYLKTQ